MGKKPKMEGSQYSAQWNPNYYKTQTQPGQWKQAISSTWKPYEPTQAVSQYQPLQGDVMKRLSSMITGGGYSPEQKQAMYTGAMTPVQEEAERQREQAQADAYSRGLGQSGVLSRSFGDIGQSLMRRGAEVAGGIEGESARNAFQNALQAIGAYQTGTQADREYQLQYDTLKSQINLDDRQMQLMLGQLEQAAYKDDYQRELAEMEIRNNFGLNQAQLEQARWIAETSAQQSRFQPFKDLIQGITQLTESIF